MSTTLNTTSTIPVTLVTQLNIDLSFSLFIFLFSSFWLLLSLLLSQFVSILSLSKCASFWYDIAGKLLLRVLSLMESKLVMLHFHPKNSKWFLVVDWIKMQNGVVMNLIPFQYFYAGLKMEKAENFIFQMLMQKFDQGRLPFFSFPDDKNCPHFLCLI